MTTRQQINLTKAIERREKRIRDLKGEIVDLRELNKIDEKRLKKFEPLDEEATLDDFALAHSWHKHDDNEG